MEQTCMVLLRIFLLSLVLSPQNDQGRNPWELLIYITSVNSNILNVSEILPKKEGGAVSSKAARPHPSIPASSEAQERVKYT